MTLSEIEKDIKSFLHGACWIQRKEVAAYLGYELHSRRVTDAIRGCPKFGCKYHVHDIASNIYGKMHS